MINLLPLDKTGAPANAGTPDDAEQDGLCRYLDWDSEFFGFGVAAVKGVRFTPESITEIVPWCEAHQVRCLSFLADSTDLEKVWLAENNGFHLVDLRLTLVNEHMAVDAGKWDDTVRPARPADIEPLKEIAGASHHDSRFYSDPGFPKGRADELYRTWIEKSCRGYADAVLVAEHEGRPAGYISCHLDSPNTGRIGLLAVGPSAQGKGVGSKLVNGVLLWFVEKGVQRVTVVTQGRNVVAQHLYQRCGFTTYSVQLWYHRWIDRQTEGVV
jgi:dTDP-4-amino-4,6-dideoxy-D-galactose acyltransferase